MIEELDIRETQAPRALRSIAEAAGRAREDSARLAGAHALEVTRVDGRTGNPTTVASTAAPAHDGDFVQRALEHLGGIRRTLGFAAVQAPEFVADPHVHESSGGARAVHLKQQFKGIDVFEAAQTVRFARDGRITGTSGASVAVDRDLDVAPSLAAADAVRIAAEHLARGSTGVADDADGEAPTDVFGEPLDAPAVDLAGFEPAEVAAFGGRPDQPRVFEAGPFGEPIGVMLVWLPVGDDLRLTWELVITMPALSGQYRVLVDADTGAILYVRQLMQSVAAEGNVYHVDGSEPRRMTGFPRAVDTLGVPVPADLPGGFPDDWVAADASAGNAVQARLADDGRTLRGQQAGGRVTFDPADPAGDDQKILNIFYYNCFMHDYFYLLGFREADGNFQHDNLGRGGAAGDRVDARSHSGAVFGTANMLTPADGRNPVMNMGLVTSTNRHTAFDSTVVFHEFVHGVTNRLVGGRMNDRALGATQSGGMGEGWSDYFACTVNETDVVGSWVTGFATGIRDFRYDERFPDDFGDLGTGRYTGRLRDGRSWPHPIGEVWCATLLEMNRRIGARLGAQLVVDGLKLTPANPSFLDARDGILAALEAKHDAGQLSDAEHAEALAGTWGAFARFGMGPEARSDGAAVTGIVPDFEPPPAEEDVDEDVVVPGGSVVVEAAPGLAIPDADAAGIVSTLEVDAAVEIGRVAVGVDIAHTYRGDLVVTLWTPGGQRITLHDRAGAGADNLVQAWTSDDHDGLGALVGEPARGSWSLQVRDLANLDVGTLRSWRIEVEPPEGAPAAVRAVATPGQPIPDNDPAGVESAVRLDAGGVADALIVEVDITHTYIGDLRVVLTAPSGAEAVLHDREGRGDDNLIRSYISGVGGALGALRGEQVRGDWTLAVRDLAGRDVGKLNRWSIEIALA